MKRAYFITGIILILLAAGGFFAWQKTVKAPTSTPQSAKNVPIPKDWKIYTNTKYHYSFRYPKEYYIYQFAGEGDIYPITQEANEVWVTDKEKSEPVLTISGTIINSIKEYFQKIDNTDLIKLSIDGKMGYEVRSKNGSPGISAITSDYFVSNLHDQVLEITVDKYNNLLAKQIFSSIKFVE